MFINALYGWLRMMELSGGCGVGRDYYDGIEKMITKTETVWPAVKYTEKVWVAGPPLSGTQRGMGPPCDKLQRWG